jgi:putative PIG3 family NAD(P)H quinone oxidoreductase
VHAIVIVASFGDKPAASAAGGELRWTEVDDPVPGPGEVLIDVVAAGVNRADLMQAAGKYPPPTGAPPYPGLECAGRIRAVDVDEGGVRGARTGWQPGDEVCALLAGGGYAEQVIVPAACVLPVPHGVSLSDAGALPEAACTVWSNLRMVAGLQPGETLLVHGGASGIGTFAIQYAVALGCEVYATARAGKHAAITALGATPIDYENDDFAGKVAADVVLDIMGASYLARNLAALKTNGRVVIIGAQGGRKAELDIGLLLAKRATVAATTLRARPLAEKAAIVAGVCEEVWPLVEQGRIRPVIDRRIPLPEAAEAHRVMAEGSHTGKLLLVAP